ncbi:MAG: hypothetical protein GC168_06770 [Candidatus Hydrogenedens sp.]|nr:hypothetical protein [Candidatus Hydrogenedens sp.]
MDQRQFFLRDILTVVFKHMKLLIFFPILVLIVVTAVSYLWPATYESVAKVKIMRGREVAQADVTVTQTTQAVALSSLTVEDVNSEIELMRSKDVLEATVMALNLQNDPDFPYGDSYSAKLFSAARTVIKQILYVTGLLGPRSAVQEAMEDLDDRLVLTHIRDSHVIEARLRLGKALKKARVDTEGKVVVDTELDLREKEDPTFNRAEYEASSKTVDMEQTQVILQVLLQKYIRHHIDVFRNPKSEPFFQQRRVEMQEALEVAQNDLQAYQNENSIAMLEKQKEDLIAAYTDAIRVLAQLQQSEEAIQGEDLNASMISTLASETDSTVVREMQLRLLELVLEQNRMAKSLGDDHPNLKSQRAQVTDAQKDLIVAIATTKEMTTKKRDAVLEELKVLNDTEAELRRKQKEVEILTQNYEFYREKQEEAAVADQLAIEQVSNVRIASDPTKPTDPVYPRKGLNMVLALIGGAVAALALAFFLDYLDHGIKTPEDIEAHLKLAPLASFFNKAGEPLNKGEAERLSVMLDQFNRSEGASIYEVASAIRGENAAQVARALADAYSNDPQGSVLLIDLAGDAGARAGAGLTDVLTGQAAAGDVFTSDSTLTIVSRGSHGEAATYLWGSAQMRQLVDDIKTRYKYVIINSGPVLSSHDTIKLARYADAVLMVIKADSTRREVVARAVDQFGENRDRVVGAVLTERTQKIPQAVYRRI